MPASGRGANLDLSRRIGAPRPKPPVPSTARPTSSTSSANLRAPVSTHPFQQAVTQSNQKVAQAVQHSAPQPTPHIPRISNPTPAQTSAALSVIHSSAVQAIGAHPSPQRVAAYQQELHSDPRNADFVKSIEHYTAAAERHTAALAGRIGSRLAEPLTAPYVSAHSADEDAATRLGVSRLQAIARGEADKPQGVGINVPGAGEINLSKIAATLASTHIVPKRLGIFSKLANEAIDLPAQTFLSSAIAGSAARSAIEGKPEALKGIGQGVLSQVEHPVRSFEEAPLSTGLLFAGGEAAVGGALGKVARAGALGDRAAELASVARPDLQLYGDEHIAGRTYNTDPLRKAAQVAYEKAMPKLPGPLRQEDAFQATGRRLKREMVGGHLKTGQVDYIRGAGERTRRVLVKGSTERVDALTPKEGKNAVPLIAQRIVRKPETLRVDLEKEAAKLRTAQPELKGSELKTNRGNLAHVEELLSNKKFMSDPSEAFAAERALTAIQRPLEAIGVHAGPLDEQQLRAAYFPYAQAHMGATPFSEQELAAAGRVGEAAALKKPEGSPLKTSEIQAHMEANGVERPGFLSHRPGISGRSSFYKSTLKQPPLERFRRTGSSFTKGTADHSFEALKGTIASQASRAAQAEVRARELNRVAIGPSYATEKEAQAVADNFHTDATGNEIQRGTLGRVVPVHLGSGKIIEAGNVHPAAVTSDVLKQFGLDEHTTRDTAELGRYALIPKDVVERMQNHDDALSTKSGGLGDIGRALQVYQQGFRRAKLNTSAPHIFGVMQEQAIRLAAENLLPSHTIGDGPITRSLRISGKTVGGRVGRAGAIVEGEIKRLAETDVHGHLVDNAGPLGARFRELEGSLGRHGGVASASRANDVVRKGDQFQRSSIGYVFHGAEAAAKSRAGELAAKPWRAYRATIEGGLSKVEHGTYNAMLGKALKGSGFIDSYRSVLKAQDGAVEQMIRGKLTPQMADALARRVDDMMGNWTHQTPTVRAAIGKFAPFGLWWLNSMRWLYRLPVTHPVKAGILGALYNATRAERNAKGQGFDSPSPVPGFLSGSIDTKAPLVGNIQLQPSYYSPGGTLGPEAFNTLAEQVLPALTGVYSAARGQNPLTGEKLTDVERNELGPLQIGTNIAAEALSGPIPGATQAQRLLQGGGKPIGTANLLTDLAHALGVGPSQVKPGTERSLPETLVKLLAPTRFAYQVKGNGGAIGNREALAHKAQRKNAPDALTAREALAEERPEAGPSAALSAREALSR